MGADILQGISHSSWALREELSGMTLPLARGPVGQRAQRCLAILPGMLAWVATGSLSGDSKVVAGTQGGASWPSWADQYLWGVSLGEGKFPGTPRLLCGEAGKEG